MHCSVDYCQEKPYAKNLCSKHYQRNLKYGNPLFSVKKRAKKGEPLNWLNQHLKIETNDCLFWPFARGGNGYGSLSFEGEIKYAHRLMLELTQPDAFPSNKQCLHSCSNGHLGCVNPRHLRWGTNLENIKDKIEANRQPKGEQCSYSKLKNNQVLEIKALFKEQKYTFRDIAKMYSVSAASIQDIFHGRNWSWLNLPEQSCSKKCNDN